MLIPVELHGLAMDEEKEQYIALLHAEEEQASDRWLPLRLEPSEVRGIAAVLNQSDQSMPRPDAYILMKEVISNLNANVDEVRMTADPEGGVIAMVLLQKPDGEVHTLRARPVDAVVLALHTGARMTVAEEIMARIDSDQLIGSDEAEKLATENLDPRLQEIQKKLDQAIQHEDFERAAELRDQLRDESRRISEEDELDDDIDEELRRAYEGSDLDQ